MPSLADLLENYRNWKGRQDWQSGKEMQDYFGGDPVAQEQFDRLSGFGTADLGGLSGLAGAIKASHGSPHVFDKFDFSKIGTGEGAQAYGHGGYFAQGFDSPVAQEYAKNLANIDQFTGLQTAHANAKNQVAKFGNDPEWAAEVIADTMRNYDPKDTQYSALADTLKFIKSGDYATPLQDKGHLYNVELKWPNAAREASDPLGEHHLLDWDAPMTKQTPEIQKAWLATKKDLPPNAIEDLGGDLSLLYGKNVTPDEFLGTLSSIGGNSGFGESLLRKAGVPGIRYLDQGSRVSSGGDLVDVFKGPQGWHSKIKVTNRSGAGFSAPTDSFTTSMPFKTEQEARDWATSKIGGGTRNYVMFDDQFPEIVSRNGVSLSDLLRR